MDNREEKDKLDSEESYHNEEDKVEEEQPVTEGKDEEIHVESSETTLGEIQEKLVRQIAETENLRRRYEKQLTEAREYSVVNFAKDLLVVVDNLQRVLDHEITDTNDEVKSLIEGVKMTYDELYKVFEKNGISELKPQIGDEFDYNVHYAISYEATNSLAPNQIADIMQCGYKIKDRLLRPAIVTVAKQAEEKDDT